MCILPYASTQSDQLHSNSFLSVIHPEFHDYRHYSYYHFEPRRVKIYFMKWSALSFHNFKFMREREKEIERERERERGGGRDAVVQ